jgi:ABC-2 type transport system permease protein
MFSNFTKYVSFLLKREKITSAIWLVAMVLCSWAIAAAYPSVFPDKNAMISMAVSMNTPAMIAMMGPVYGLDTLNISMVFVQECLLWFMLAAAIMNILLINRHTRTDEEQGRTEMLLALPNGRLTPAVSAFAVSFMLNIAISLFTALTLVTLNIEGMNFAGAMSYGFAIGGAGMAFAGITLLFAQLFSTAHGVSFAAIAAFLLAYIWRGYYDVSGNSLTAISPFGLGLRTFAFYENNIVPILILFAEGAIFAVIALIINAKRDTGSGVFAARKGKTRAGRFLKSPLGLAWRLEKNSLYAWIIGIFVLGISYGAVVPQLSQFAEKNDMMRKMMEANGANSLLEGFMSMLAAIIMLVASVPVINAVNKLCHEEKRGRVEPILTKSVSRSKLLSSYILMAFCVSLVMPFSSALGFWAGAGKELILSQCMAAMFVYLPAVWVVLGICVAIIGWLPKLISLIWAVFAYSFFIMYMGRLLNLKGIIVHISPFGNIPQLPVEKFDILPLILLTIVAILFVVIGYCGFKKRDIG